MSDSTMAVLAAAAAAAAIEAPRVVAHPSDSLRDPGAIFARSETSLRAGADSRLLFLARTESA
jgi:hypothetical protein